MLLADTPPATATTPPAPPRAATPPGAVAVIANDAQALDTARRLAADFATTAVERDRERRLPWDELDAFSGSGLWAITVPRAHGGAGVSGATLAEVIARVSAADGSLGQIPQNHFYAVELLRLAGTAEQQRFFYGRVLAGERLGNALAEIGHKDFKRRTRIEPAADGGFRLQGRKFYCTGALYAHWIPTMAVAQETAPDGTVREAPHLVFVPRHAPGVQVIDDWDGFGQRVTGSGSVVLDDVRIEPGWVVRLPDGLEQTSTARPFAHLMHSAIDLGIGRGALAATLDVVRDHARPWIDAKVARAADDPLLLQQIGDTAVRLRAAEALVRRAARLLDAAQAAPTPDRVAAASVAVSEARVLTTTASLDAGTRLFELGGTAATLDGRGLDRFWRNARTHTLHDPVRWRYHAVGDYHLNGRHPALQPPAPPAAGSS